MVLLGKLTRSRIAVPALLLAAALAGCADAGSPDALVAPDVAAAAPGGVRSETARWIGPQGGTVELDGFRLVVPPAAVDRPVRFSIRLPSAAGGAVEFGPHGQAFRKPVRVELPYAGASASGPRANVIGAGGAAQEWVELPGGGVTDDGEHIYFWTDGFTAFSADDGDDGDGTTQGTGFQGGGTATSTGG